MPQGRGARARAKERRLKARRAKKTAQRALYESRRNQGINSKSKRYRRNAKAQGKSRVRELASVVVLVNGEWSQQRRMAHAGSDCGNVGCGKCSPSLQRLVA